MYNGKKFPGRVWALDEASDIALVKLDVPVGDGGNTSYIISTPRYSPCCVRLHVYETGT